MSETVTTSNGFEIAHPVEQITPEAFKERMAGEYGLDGKSPHERIEQLKKLSVEGVAILLEDINKSVQGSEDSLMNHDGVMKIGETETIKPENRYDVFLHVLEAMKESSDTINPARIGDVLALSVVLLHPFHDGNGRTARVLGLLFRNEYDTDEYVGDFTTVTEPRDRARERGGFMVNGYIPRFPEGFDQSDSVSVTHYLTQLLREERPGSYIGCYGQAPLMEAA